MFGIEEDFQQLMEQVYGPLDEGKMTDKITLELTLDELKTLDKHIEYNEETKSVFDKIKYAYPQPKMTFAQSGEFTVVSYNDTTYYRLMGEDATCFCWYMKIEYSTPTLVMVTDAETERLLEGLYYNHIVVKKEKEPKDNEWKNVALEFGKKLPVILPYSYAELSPNAWYRWVVFTYDKYMEERDKECGYTPNQKEQKWDAVRESVKWCEENQDKDPLDWLTPKTPQETEESLKEAFREAVKKGVVSSSTKSPTLYDICMKWWNVAYREDCINDLVNRIEAWLPEEQSAAGSQNAYVECTVEGFNDCLTKIKGKLR